MGGEGPSVGLLRDCKTSRNILSRAGHLLPGVGGPAVAGAAPVAVVVVHRHMVVVVVVMVVVSVVRLVIIVILWYSW